MTEFVLSIVQRQVGTPLAIGDLIEYPFRSGHAWYVFEIDRDGDRVVLTEPIGERKVPKGRASLPEV